MSRSDQMVVARDLPSLSYRELPHLNQSMVKLFSENPVEFVRQHKLGYRPRDRKTSVSMIIGDIVDFYILECQGDESVFDHTHHQKFVLFEGEKGSGQAFVLADELFEVAKECVTEDGKVGCSFDEMFSEAFLRVQAKDKYKGKSEGDALLDFNKKAYSYYEALMKNVGKTVVEASLLQKAKLVAHTLLEDAWTKNLFQSQPAVEFLPKFAIEWEYEVDGVTFQCKSELDMLFVDHGKKIIFPKDIKTSYDNEKFLDSYLDFGYYIQAAFYSAAARYWATKNGMQDYMIEPMEFVVGDTSAACKRPLRYQLSPEDLLAGFTGFTHKGVYYKGLSQLMKEIAWAEKNDTWNVGKAAYESRGVLPLNLTYA